MPTPTLPSQPSTPRPDLLARLVRRAGVSVVVTAFTMTVLGVLVGAFDVRPTVANLVATALATGPALSANRRWVWCEQGRCDLRRHVAPFWGMSFAGLALSTTAVAVADGLATTIALGPRAHMVAVQAASLSAWGVLWVAQFFVLDRLVFRPATVAAGR